MLDSIKDAAASTVQTASKAVQDPDAALDRLKDKVADAPAAIARGAQQAVRGVAELGVRGARGAVNWAKEGHAALKAGPGETLAFAAKTGKQVGTWAWDNKAEIGFWVGTTALMLAIPVSGGASGAAAGGLMATRGAAVAAKVATMGKTGAAAVKLGKAGVVAMRGARGAVTATKAGGAVVKAGQTVKAGRVALGATKAGKVMIAAQKPVTAASTVLAGAHFADTSVKFARGEAGMKDMALATLGFAPTAVAGIRGAAVRRATAANAQAARVATGRLDHVATHALNATDDAAKVARVAPAVNAPQTAGAASSAIDEASEAVLKARDLQSRAALTARSSARADDAISASSLMDELDDVAHQARTARTQAQAAEQLAPAQLSPIARDARQQLSSAEQVADRTRRDIAQLAHKQRTADRIVNDLDMADGMIGTTSTHAHILNNAVAASREQQGTGFSTTDHSLLRGIANYLLGRSAKVQLPAAAAS